MTMTTVNSQTDSDLDRELEAAAACCRDLDRIYATVEKAVSAGAPASTLYQYLEEMRGAQQEMVQCGERIESLAAQSAAEPSRHPGFAAWQQSMARSLAQNQRIMRHVKAALAVAKDELDRMRTGKQALGGYHSKGSARGQNAGARIDCGA
jgi:hypothetical protein